MSLKKMLAITSISLASSLSGSIAAAEVILDWAELSRQSGGGGKFTFSTMGEIDFVINPALADGTFQGLSTGTNGLDFEEHAPYTHESGGAFMFQTTEKAVVISFDFSAFTGNLAEDLVLGLGGIAGPGAGGTTATFSSSTNLLSDLNGNAIFDGTNLTKSKGGTDDGDFLFDQFGKISSFDVRYEFSSRDQTMFSFAERSVIADAEPEAEGSNAAVEVPVPGTLVLFFAAGLGLIFGRRQLNS